MSDDIDDNLPPSAVPVNDLTGLHAGDVVHIIGRKHPLRVVEARVGYAELVGIRGGTTKLTNWKASVREDNEYSIEGGRARVELWCSQRGDGSKPQNPVGVPVDRTPVSGGFSTEFTNAGDF